MFGVSIIRGGLMMEKRLVLPEQRNYEQALSQAIQIACQKLSIRNIPELCLKSGAKYIETALQKTIAVNYMGQEYWVALPESEVLNPVSREKLPPHERLLILHYLLTAKGARLTRKQVTLKEIPDGLIYFPTFTKRALKPLIDNFGKDPSRLVEVAAKLGGKKADYGDAAITLDIFSYVPLTFVLWRCDEEFPTSASILFDSSITDYLPVEDIIVLSEITAWKLVKLSPLN